MSEFDDEAARGRQGFFAELVAFLREHKKWWLLPTILVLAALGVLVMLASTGAGPMIYTLF